MREKTPTTTKHKPRKIRRTKSIVSKRKTKRTRVEGSKEESRKRVIITILEKFAFIFEVHMHTLMCAFDICVYMHDTYIGKSIFTLKFTQRHKSSTNSIQKKV